MGRINLGCSPLNVMAEEDVVDFCNREFDRQSVPLLSVYGSRIRFIHYIINEAHRFINYEASWTSLNFDLFVVLFLHLLLRLLLMFFVILLLLLLLLFLLLLLLLILLLRPPLLFFCVVYCW